MYKNYLLLIFAFSITSLSAWSQPVTASSSTSSAPDQPALSLADGAPSSISPGIEKMFTVASKFDELNPKGWETPFPSIGDTVVQDEGGIRSELAAHNIGISVWNMQNYYNNVLHGTRDPQVYLGQKPTYLGFEFVFATYNVPSHHLQFTIAGAQWNTTWVVQGPNSNRLQTLKLHQDLIDGRFEWDAGYLNNDPVYYGGYTGGNFASGSLGYSAVLPYEVGESHSPYVVPAINLKYKVTRRLYERFGAQRSLPTAGAFQEKINNPSGFRFSAKGARALFINEIGYKQNAEPGVKQRWYRATGWYNRLHYPDYRTAGAMADNNWALSAAGDAQLLQTNKVLPFQGLYAGASVQYAPPQQNLYSQYYEARLFQVGMVPGRPFDMTTLILTRTQFSNIVRNYFSRIPAQIDEGSFVTGVPSYGNSTGGLLTYLFHLNHGTNFNAGAGYSFHPQVAPRLNSPLVLQTSIVQFF